jgi:hypothetical protein
VDDVIGRLTAKYGPINPVAEFLAKRNGAWRGVPATSGTQNKPALCRFDLLQQHAGLDVRAMWPARAEKGPGADTWNWDTFLRAAEACHRANVPFGLPMGQFTDAVDWVGALFASYGARITDERGNPTIRGNQELRQVVDYAVRLSRFLPNDVWAWDDASNNRALISGRSALVFNPPSAWAVAKRDAPQVAENCWTIPMPAGPQGRFIATCPDHRHLGLRPQQDRGQGLPGVPDGTRERGVHDQHLPAATTSRPSPAWRLPRVGDRGAAGRHHLQLPAEAAPRRAAIHRLRACAGGTGQPDVHPGAEHQGDRPHRAGRRERGLRARLARARDQQHAPRRLGRAMDDAGGG